jgi:hypothetical protein
MCAGIVGRARDGTSRFQSRTRAGVETALKIALDDPRRHRLLIESSATEPLRRRRLEFIQAVAAVMAAVGTEFIISAIVTGAIDMTHSECP